MAENLGYFVYVCHSIAAHFMFSVRFDVRYELKSR